MLLQPCGICLRSPAHRLTGAHTQKSVNALINYLTFHLGGDGLQSPHNKQREYIITCVLGNM